ncbi:hypothetical protein AS361_04880 [Myroides marinus]|uniref:WYL domain-containing protein n=1 Tax=Myroides marinus TaxID=703342 RepID=UPI00074222D5|nr:WYL domain-containing protein [Myroides marinus]KUF46472.1 hypothetical protein AS361_04880 [Myroides marinus]
MTVNQINAIILFLDNFLFSNHKYSRKQFAEALQDKGLSNKDSFITDVFKNLRGFGIELQYNRSLQCYQLEQGDNKQEVLRNFQNIKNLLSLEMISHKLRQSPTLTKYVQLGYSNENKGFNYVKDCLEAILTKRYIKIQHKPFYKQESSTYTVIPLFLKEYLNRWYLIIEPLQGYNYNILALDRVKSLEILDKEFSWTQTSNFSMFNDMVGVDLSSDIEIVTLEVYGNQINYIETLPLHFSQKILNKDNNTMTIELKVRTNYEFVQLILGAGSSIRVLSPDSLKTKIKNHVLKMATYY